MTVTAEQDVRELQIPVENAPGMQEVERHRDLSDALLHDLLGNAPVVVGGVLLEVVEEVVQVAGGSEVHDEAAGRLSAKSVLEGRQERMAGGLGHAGPLRVDEKLAGLGGGEGRWGGEMAGAVWEGVGVGGSGLAGWEGVLGR